MFRIVYAVLMFFCFDVMTQPALAWDEVTHSHITLMAIEKVHTPALKAFLEAHRNEVISGSWFPDWPFQGTAKKKGYAHAIYLDAVWADLQKPSVKRGANYNRFLAHFMGTYGHVVEDRTFDSTLGASAEDLGDTGRDDMETGMVSIATYGYLKRNFSLYVPKDDLARVYAENAFFGETAIRKDNLASFMHVCMEKQAIENRELKLLSFLTAGWARRQFPFAAANMATAPGGFEDNARAVAAVWEAMWAKAHDKTVPLLVFSIPGQNGRLGTLRQTSPLGRILVVAAERIDTRMFKPGDISLRGEKSGPVKIHIMPGLDVDKNRDVSFAIEASQPWVRGERYHLAVAYTANSGHTETYNLDFSAPRTATTYSKAPPEPLPWAFGLWCASALLGLGAMIYGVPGLLSMILATFCKRRTCGVGWPWRCFLLTCRTIGIGFAMTALWFLATDGAWLIAYLRLHH